MFAKNFAVPCSAQNPTQKLSIKLIHAVTESGILHKLSCSL